MRRAATASGPALSAGYLSPPAEWEGLLALFPPAVRSIITRLPPHWQNQLREIRLRTGRPLIGVFASGDHYLAPAGTPVNDPELAYRVSPEDAEAFLHAITRSSVYALEREFRQGFLTLPGGHRVGLSGQALMEGESLRSLRHVGGFNVRIARQVRGAADLLLPRIVEPHGVAHTLVVSPPGCGKTTVLRDLARQLSAGPLPGLTGRPGLRVVLIDERFELAAGRQGVPQLDVGPHTDVIDGCPKAVAIPLALRALGPQVIITDEIGGPEDAAVLADVQRAGVSVIASVHARDPHEALERAGSERLLWQRVAVFSDRLGPGTLEQVVVISPSPSP